MKTILTILLLALATPAPAAEQFKLCSGGHRVTCVVDGDTIWLHRVKIRIADIDTPETQEGQYHCPAEKALGDRATRRLIELLNAGPFELASWERDHDRGGRKLRVLMRGGRSIGLQLVREGFARKWDGSRHPWC